jgi:hypothetical protein
LMHSLTQTCWINRYLAMTCFGLQFLTGGHSMAATGQWCAVIHDMVS